MIYNRPKGTKRWWFTVSGHFKTFESNSPKNKIETGSETVERILTLTLEPCDCILQGLKVLFFTIGAIYLVYLVYLLFRAYSELRAMPYFGKFMLPYWHVNCKFKFVWSILVRKIYCAVSGHLEFKFNIILQTVPLLPFSLNLKRQGDVVVLCPGWFASLLYAIPAMLGYFLDSYSWILAMLPRCEKYM